MTSHAATKIAPSSPLSFTEFVADSRLELRYESVAAFNAGTPLTMFSRPEPKPMPQPGQPAPRSQTKHASDGRLIWTCGTAGFTASITGGWPT